MTGEGHATGGWLADGVAAAGDEKRPSTPGAEPPPGTVPHSVCRNCGALLSGRYCSNCGQSAHIHRSLLSLAHDILHGVFHFEGKVWRTIPELCLHPGRLTRRYIDGERVKFVSPMALFLFTVFVMFAVFSFVGGAPSEQGTVVTDEVASKWSTGNDSAMAAVEEKQERLRERLEGPEVTPAERARLEEEIAGLDASLEVMNALGAGDMSRLAELREQQQEPARPAARSSHVELGWPALDTRLNARLQELDRNPALILYKLKTSGYKYSWVLVPMSVPFLWLLFFWRRDVHLYDHAVFVTYSISFMMLLLTLSSVASAAGIGAGVWATALMIAPPVHVYAQLRGTYGLSRAGALVRLFLLLIVGFVVLVLFMILLLLLGILG